MLRNLEMVRGVKTNFNLKRQLACVGGNTEMDVKD
jgi:hypothetical protein